MTEKKKTKSAPKKNPVPKSIETSLSIDKKQEILDEITGRDKPQDRYPAQRR